ncbi:hypothetical protein GW927_03235 [Candidatus Pacearchaeota archaeon]|nr:hypothetical protein [Candidatus Pacearchaeota archaeon]
MNNEWFTSVVRYGSKDGTKHLYPTVNLDPLVLPKNLKRGVYASWVRVNGITYPGAAYFGPRIIKEESFDVLEIYILDFSAKIYGEKIDFKLEQFIRGVMDFTDFSKLKEQITADVLNIQRVLHVQIKD